MDLQLTTTSHGPYAVVTVSGEVDLETASLLGDHTLAASQEVSPHVVLDLSRVTFLDSTGLKVLITAQRRAQLAGGSLALVGVTRPVMKVFSVTGLDATFAIYDTVEDAAATGPTADAG
jgi:anti-sigma B factor antagonist